MATDLAEKAKAAFVDDDFQLAIDLYTQAINISPRNADLFADRAQANIKLGNYTEAVADASRAIELDPSMTKAYYRKGTACFKLEEYHTAKAALERGAFLSQNDSRFTKLIAECDEHIIAEEANKLSSSLTLNAPPVPAHEPTGSQLLDKTTGNVLEAEQGVSILNQSKETQPVQPKYRHSYYQKPDEVVVTVLQRVYQQIKSSSTLENRY